MGVRFSPTLQISCCTLLQGCLDHITRKRPCTGEPATASGERTIGVKSSLFLLHSCVRATASLVLVCGTLGANFPGGDHAASPSPARGDTANGGMPGILLVSEHLRVRIVDNGMRMNSVDYSPLPGYNGIASLVATEQGRNIFAPAGLDYECSSTIPRMGKRADLWNAPRVAPMAIEQGDDRTVRLTQRGSEAAGLNAEIEFRLGDRCIDQTITTWPDSDIQSSNTFWASYLLFVQNTSLYLRGCLYDTTRKEWLEMTSAGHNGTGGGTYFRPCDPVGKAWYDFLSDNPVRRQAIVETPDSRAATERAGFKPGTLKSFDNFFFGFVDDYVALWIFRQPSDGRFSPWISASGNQALRRPAADFSLESGPQKAGERRTFFIRFVYKPYAGLDDLLSEVERFQSGGARRNQ